jgi:hypothetical protein
MSEFVELVLKSLGLTQPQLQFLTRAAWVIFVSFHILWVCGWLTALGLMAPFASAQDLVKQNTVLQQLASQLLDDQLHKLDYDIFQLRVQQCHAPADKKDQYAVRLQELINGYAKLTKQYPRVPPCDEL